MLDLIFLNLRYIGYAAVLLGIVWLANFLLDLYYNIAIVLNAGTAGLSMTEY